MRKTTSYFVITLLLGLISVTSLFAATMPNLEKALPNLEKALDAWQGTKEVQLSAAEGDPLASPELLPLLEILLQHGFAVSTASGKTTGTGLLIETRQLKHQYLVVLKRASDNAIVALDRTLTDKQPAATPAAARPAVTAPVASAEPAPTMRRRPAVRQTRQHAPIPLDDPSVAMVWLNGSNDDGGDLALVSTSGVTLYRLQGKHLQKNSVTPPPKKGLHPLSLSYGDVDGDGSFELAVVWAEDIYSIYDGTDSNIWSQLLAVDQGKLTPLGPLQTGYIRLTRSGGLIQQRGTYSAFSGPVKKLLYQQGEFSPAQSLPWGVQNIFSLTPWDREVGLAWQEQDHLAMIDMNTGTLLPGGTLLKDFDPFKVAQIAVRLEEPIYRGGFGKEEQIMETYVPLPPRLFRYDNNSMFTIQRGRTPARLILSKADGEDHLVRLNKTDDGFFLEYPFPAVEMFIVDFAIPPGGDGSEVLLLLNEKDNASGQAFLLYQQESSQ